MSEKNKYYNYVSFYRGIPVYVGKGLDKRWENNTLNGEVSCLTIVADTNEHNVLKFAKLWKPVQ